MEHIQSLCSFPYTKWKSHWAEEVNVIYVWTINNFHKIFRVHINSPYFTADGYEDTFWKVELQVRDNWISASLKLCDSSVPAFDVKCRFSIINSKGEKINAVDKLYIEHTPLVSKTCFQKLVEKEKLFEQSKDLIPGDSLTIHCQVMFVICKDHLFEDFVQLETPEAELSKLFKNLVFNDKYSDVNFLVHNHTYPAHKAFLASRSKVFADMFEAAENKLESVLITDINPEVFKEILNYIYTGKVPRLGDMAKELLYAAEKYDLEELKLICSKIPSDKPTAQQAADLLFLAEDYDAESLKEKALIKIKLESNYAIITKGGKNTIVVCEHASPGACAL